MTTANPIDSHVCEPSVNDKDPSPRKRGVSLSGGQTREAYWADFLKRQAQSGLTIKAFCFREGVSTWSFYTWRRRFRLRDRSPKQSDRLTQEFIELLPRSGDSGVHIDVGGRFRVVVARNFDAEALRVTLKLSWECAECCQ